MDEQSPFYDSTTTIMNPLAKLYIQRQRIYEKECDKSLNVEDDKGVNRPITRSKY
jgi:hypothetical protein